jgi:histidine ammonia-lyase
MLDNVRAIVAIELLTAARGIDFRRPLRTSDALEDALARVSPAARGGDRYIAPDIERVAVLVRAASFTPLVADLFPSVDGSL